jgi:hypothetical protein
MSCIEIMIRDTSRRIQYTVYVSTNRPTRPQPASMCQRHTGSPQDCETRSNGMASPSSQRNSQPFSLSAPPAGGSQVTVHRRQTSQLIDVA